MSRIVFRVLFGLTLLVMWVARLSGGRMNPYEFLPFYYWFVISVFVFTGFGIAAVVRIWKDPANRRPWLFDIALAAIWIPYWFANLR